MELMKNYYVKKKNAVECQQWFNIIQINVIMRSKRKLRVLFFSGILKLGKNTCSKLFDNSIMKINQQCWYDDEGSENIIAMFV